MTLGRVDIVKLEEIANAAMPALETQPYDGWTLRFAQGYTKRANSVHPLHASTLELETKITFCETHYAIRGQPTIFKMTPTSQPTDLDAALAARGYTFASPTLMQTRKLTSGEQNGVLCGDSQLSDAWFTAYQILDPVKEKYHQILYKSLALIPYHSWYAALTNQDEKIIAVGLGLQQDEYIGIFNIVVDESQRGRGLGRQIIMILLNWGFQQGARKAYLQVSANNTPALRLYRSLGFQTAYEYWYRILDV